MDVHLQELAARQSDVVAAWQLLAMGWVRGMIDHRVGGWGWRVVHPGVYALTHAPLTARQRWIAATLITPDTVLSHASAAACWGFRPFEPPFETVTRPGSGGPRRVGGLLVARSKTLDGDVTRHEGIAITTAERTLVDLAPYLAAGPLGRAFREAQRLRAATAQGLRSTLSRHRGRRGTRLLEELSRRYSQLPYDRARSDAESRALELLHDARIAPPRMNTRIAGEEADLAWPAHRLVVEIDGAQYHQFRAEDVRKQRTWERAGYRVRRIDSEVVYRQPARLIALAPVASPLVDG